MSKDDSDFGNSLSSPTFDIGSPPLRLWNVEDPYPTSNILARDRVPQAHFSAYLVGLDLDSKSCIPLQQLPTWMLTAQPEPT